VRDYLPWFKRFWGDGIPKSKRINIFRKTLEWAIRDPVRLRKAALALATGGAPDDDATRLLAILKRHDPLDAPGRLSSERLLRGRPEALIEAVEILINRPSDVRAVMTRFPFTDDGSINGFLDQDLR
jgi:hypothetical protein